MKRRTVHICLTLALAVTSKVKLFASNQISTLSRNLGETKGWPKAAGVMAVFGCGTVRGEKDVKKRADVSTGGRDGSPALKDCITKT